MFTKNLRLYRPLSAALLLVGLFANPISADESLFERDVLPILTKNCLGCHGGLKQKGGLEMRTIAAGLKGGKTGPAWKAGDLKASEAWNRVVSDEMPPNERKLSAAEKEHLKKWIQAGLPTVAERRKSIDPILKPGSKHEVRQVAAAIDQHIQRALDEAKLKAMPTIGDAEFLRRIYLDLAGRVPTAEQAAQFLDDKNPGKRAKLIDSLLETNDFATQFGRTWREWIVPPELPANINGGNNCANQARDLGKWMGDRALKGDGWDQVVRDILTAKGGYRGAKGANASPQGIFFQLAGARGGEPIPNGAARLVASVFMGVQIRCAECHDDPYKNWSQKEFWALGAFFQRLDGSSNFGGLQEYPFVFDKKKEGKEARSLTDRLEKFGFKRGSNPAEIIIPAQAFKNVGAKVQAGFLKGEEFRTTKEESLRPYFADWLTRKENPYFAKAFANRMWFYFFARGIVQPVDDFRDLNPPTHPGLMAMLADEFADSKFDIKHLLRCICNSETYQRSSKILPGMNEPQTAALTAAYGRMPLRVLGAEPLYDSLNQVYGTDLEKNKSPLDLRGVDPKNEATKGDGATVKSANVEFVRRFCIDKEDATLYLHGIPQRLTMLNHPRLLQGSKALDAFHKPAKTSEKSAEQVVEWLYLSTLSRRPSDIERSETQAYLEKSPGDYISVLWALINRSEYQLIR